MHVYTGESIKAAEEDIAAWRQQRKLEDSQVAQEDVKEKNSIAQDIIREENDELKLIESHCKEDIKDISMYYLVLAGLLLMSHCLLVDRKLGELDTELLKVKAERDKTQKKLNDRLQENRSEQDRLRERLAQLEREDHILTTTINQNTEFQEEANKVLMSNLVRCYSWHTIGV